MIADLWLLVLRLVTGPHGAVGVRCTNCGGPDLWSKIGVAAGIVGGVGALGAWFLASRSARDSSSAADAARRTATVAEQQFALFREEVEAARADRARRPELELSVGASAAQFVNEAPRAVVVTVGIKNTGTAGMHRAVVNLVMPRALDPRPAADVHGNGTGEGRIDSGDEDLGRGVEPMAWWHRILEPIEPGPNYVVGGVRCVPLDGTHPIVLKIVHAGLPDGGMTKRYNLIVAGAGAEVGIESP